MAAAPMADQNGTSDGTDLDLKPPPGVIIPPKDIRLSLEKIAGFVARNGAPFEQRVIDQLGKNKVQFIFPDNPYNAYYLWRLSEIKEGRGTATSAGHDGPIAQKKKTGPEQPPDFHFSARMPNMSAGDLETVKLTAQFTAKNGRPWMTTLSQAKMTDPSFAFLRPQHSWHSFFTRLVDQYTELITGDTVDRGRPQKEKEEMLKKNIENPFHILERAKKRAEWVKYQESQKEKQVQEDEAEKLAFAQIDWQDFTVVETITFDETDDQTALPPPTTLNDLQSASLEQKAQMSLAPSSHRIEESVPGMDDFIPMPDRPTDWNPSQTTTPTPMAMPPPPQPYMPSPAPSPAGITPYATPPIQQSEESSRVTEAQAQQQRAEAARAAASGQGPMRIRQDYVPRAQARRQAPAVGICPNCKRSIPLNEMDEHIRSTFSLPSPPSLPSLQHLECFFFFQENEIQIY